MSCALTSGLVEVKALTNLLSAFLRISCSLSIDYQFGVEVFSKLDNKVRFVSGLGEPDNTEVSAG